MVFWGLGLVGFGDADFPGVDVWCWDCFLVGCGLWAAGFCGGGFVFWEFGVFWVHFLGVCFRGFGCRFSVWCCRSLLAAIGVLIS